MRIAPPFLALALALAGASAAHAQGMSVPSVSSRPGAPMVSGQLPAAEEPAPPAPGSGGRSTPSAPATAAAPGAMPTVPPAMSEPRRTSTMSMPVDPRGGGWEGTAPPTATLDSVLNSGAPLGASKVPRKVCPPGLMNRDGNCVAPAGAIMRP